MSRHVLFLVCTVLFFWACKPGVPSGLIQPSELEEILYEYHLAQAMAEMNRGDSMDYRRYGYVRAVLDKYGVTEAEFDSTMVWYSSHATYLSEIYKRLKERFKNEVTVMGEAMGSKDLYLDLGMSGDTANIWSDRTFRILKPRFPENRMQFVMHADSSFRKDDEVMWRFDVFQINKGKSSEIHAGLYVTYDNDSTAGLTKRVYSSSTMQINLERDTAHVIKSIGGFVCYKEPEDDKEFKMLMLDRIVLVRFHHAPDTLSVDSTAMEAIADSATLRRADSLRQILPTENEAHRQSPQEFRDSRPMERSIQVVKEKPYMVRERNPRNVRKNNSVRK